MNKKQSWIKKYWWVILLSLLILGYFIFVSIINDCCLNRITKDLLGYINLIITPLGVILGLVLGYPLLKKKVVEDSVRKQFDIVDNSNREVRKLCIKLSEKYPAAGDSTRLTEVYVEELVKDIKQLHQVSIDANRDTFRYISLLYKSICKFYVYKSSWSYEETQKESYKHEGYYAVYYKERICSFVNKHLQDIYTLSTSVGFMPSSEINTTNIVTKKLDGLVRDNDLYQIEGLHRSLLYHHSSALLVSFFGNTLASLSSECGLLMECCYRSIPTPSALARILHLNNKYIPLIIEGEGFAPFPMFKPRLCLVGYIRRYSTPLGSDVRTHHLICHYANISDFGFLGTPPADKSFFKDFKDKYLTKNTFNVDDIEILHYDKERIIVKIPEIKALEYYQTVKRELVKKLKSENN